MYPSARWTAVRYFGCTSIAPMRNDGRCRMAMRPVCVPRCFPFGMSARTMSPVWKPKDVFGLRAGCPLATRTCPTFVVVAAVPARLDQQGPHAFDQERLRGAGPDARGVQPVRLGQAAGRAVELGPTARAALDRQARRLEPPEQLPAGGVDRRGVLERPLGVAAGPSPDRSGSFFRKSSTGRLPLRRLHGSHARVRFETRSVPPLLRGTMCSTWSGTSVLSQYAHVRSCFSSRYSRNSYPASVPCWYSMPEISGSSLFLEIEPDQLLRRRGDRAEPAQPRDPGEHVGKAAFQRRREPALGFRLRLLVRGLGLAPRPAVSRLAGPPVPSEGLAVGERRLDRLAPVLDLDRGDDPARLLLDDCNAGRLRAGIDLDPMLVDGESSTSRSLRMIVNGNRRKTAARPCLAGSGPVPAGTGRAASGRRPGRRLACVLAP